MEPLRQLRFGFPPFAVRNREIAIGKAATGQLCGLLMRWEKLYWNSRPAARPSVALAIAAIILPFPGRAADSQRSIADVPVVSEKMVSPPANAATAIAAGGGTPVEVALAVAGPFEGKTQHIIQENDRSEGAQSTDVII